MKKLILASMLVAVPAFSLWAHSDDHGHSEEMAESDMGVISQRMDIMSNFGKSLKELGPMAKGEAEFDAARAQEILDAVAGNSAKLVDLFPEDSRTGTGHQGHETEVSPAIWEDREAFDEILGKFIDDTKMAADAQPQSADELGAAIKIFAGDCKACHQDFRVKKN